MTLYPEFPIKVNDIILIESDTQFINPNTKEYDKLEYGEIGIVTRIDEDLREFDVK